MPIISVNPIDKKIYRVTVTLGHNMVENLVVSDDGLYSIFYIHNGMSHNHTGRILNVVQNNTMPQNSYVLFDWSADNHNRRERVYFHQIQNIKDVTPNDAYQIAIKHGFVGSVEDWLESMRGYPGKSNYEIAVECGYEGTQAEYIESCRGARGYSAYEIAFRHGFKGTEEEWLESLKGEMGPEGPMGPQGEKGEQGEVGPQGPQGIQGEDGIGVESMLIDEGHLYVTLTNGQLVDAGEIPVNGEGGGSNPEVDKELAATKAELLEARQKLADLTYGVDYEWIYFCEQPSAGLDKLTFNQETAPKFYEDWLPVLESGDDDLIEDFIVKMYEEDIYRMYVLRLTIEHKLYNRYELIPLADHAKQPGVSDYLKDWNPTSTLTSWNWTGDEDGGFTIDAKPSSGLVIAFMKVKEEFRLK